MSETRLFIGYEYKDLLRYIGFFLFLSGFLIFIINFQQAELIALSFVLMFFGAYVFSIKSFIEIKDDQFRILTSSFFLFENGKWLHRETYPLTSLKSVQKTYALPRISRQYSAPDILITDMDQRVVLTDAHQRRFINLKDFKNGKEATHFINKVNRFLGTEYAMWGSRMKK